MTEALLYSVFDSTAAEITGTQCLLCTVVSLLLGLMCAGIYMFRNQAYSKGFVMTLVVLPAIVQLVIMLVNGNLGASVAVAGAFSLVRFRSAPGTAREITGIFLAMATGLATGMGYLVAPMLFVLLIGAVTILLTASPFGGRSELTRSLRITIPESLDYGEAFKDIFEKYLASWKLQQVRTTNMGSMFRLDYEIVMKQDGTEKLMLDELRTRNGNLEILCRYAPMAPEGGAL